MTDMKTRAPIVRVNAKSQQFAMKMLGFYHGPIDGIWGRKTTEAAKAWSAKHGGRRVNGQQWRDPQNLPRYFSWSRLDNQEFVLYNDPTGEVTHQEYIESFIQICAPEDLEVPPEPKNSPADVRQAALQKSQDLLDRRALEQEDEQNLEQVETAPISLARMAEVMQGQNVHHITPVRPNIGVGQERSAGPTNALKNLEKLPPEALEKGTGAE